MKFMITALVLILVSTMDCGGEYLGNYSANPHASNSTANQFGAGMRAIAASRSRSYYFALSSGGCLTVE